MEITCEYCGKTTEKFVGHVNRARKQGNKLYCDRECSGLGRRTTKAEKIDVKRIYDIKYRAENKEMLKEKEKAYNESPAGRAMQKRQREKNKDNHREYIKSDKYRAWKHDYDQRYNAKKNYGEFWESSLLLKDIEAHIDKYEVSILNNNYNKSQKRRRNEKVNSK